jgi:hypothetical protein
LANDSLLISRDGFTQPRLWQYPNNSNLTTLTDGSRTMGAGKTKRTLAGALVALAIGLAAALAGGLLVSAAGGSASEKPNDVIWGAPIHR